MSTRKLAGLGVLGALSLALVSLLHFPVFPTVPFLEYDMADVPIFLAAFMYGPVLGLLLTVIVCVFQAFLLGGNGVYGLIMHLIATGTYVLVAGLIYKNRKNVKGAIFAQICGVIAWIIVMIGANYIVTPAFMGVPAAVITDLLIWIVLFNLIKSVGNSIITFILYKRTHKLFRLISLDDAPLTEHGMHIKSEETNREANK